MVQGRYEQTAADMIAQRETERLAMRLDKETPAVQPWTAQVGAQQQQVAAVGAAPGLSQMPLVTPTLNQPLPNQGVAVALAPVSVVADATTPTTPTSPTTRMSWFDRHFGRRYSRRGSTSNSLPHVHLHKQPVQTPVQAQPVVAMTPVYVPQQQVPVVQQTVPQPVSQPMIQKPATPPPPVGQQIPVTVRQAALPTSAVTTTAPIVTSTIPNAIPVTIIPTTSTVAPLQPVVQPVRTVQILPQKGAAVVEIPVVQQGSPMAVQPDTAQLQRLKQTEQQLLLIQQERQRMQQQLVAQQQQVQQQLLNKDQQQQQLERDIIAQQTKLQQQLQAKETDQLQLRQQLQQLQLQQQQLRDQLTREQQEMQQRLLRKDQQTHQLEEQFQSRQSQLQAQLLQRETDCTRLQQQFQQQQVQQQNQLQQLQQQQFQIQEQLRQKEQELQNLHTQRQQFQVEQMRQIQSLQEQLQRKEQQQRQLEYETQQQRTQIELVVRQKEQEMRNLEQQLQVQRQQQQQLVAQQEQQHRRLQELLQRKDQREHQLESELQHQQEGLRNKVLQKDQEVNQLSRQLEQKEYEIQQLRQDLQQQKLFVQERVQADVPVSWGQQPQMSNWKREYYHHSIDDILPFNAAKFTTSLTEFPMLIGNNNEFRTLLFEFNTLVRQTLSANLMFSSIPPQQLQQQAQAIPSSRSRGFNEKAFMRIFDYELDDQSRKLLAIQWQDFFRRLFNSKDVLHGFKLLIMSLEMLGVNSPIEQDYTLKMLAQNTVSNVQSDQGISIRKFREALGEIKHRSKEDVHFWEEMVVLKFFLWHALNDLAFVESQEFTDDAICMINRFRLLAHRHGQTISRALLKFNFILEKLRNKAAQQLPMQPSMQQGEPRDILFYDQGRPTLKPEFLEQFRMLLIPTVVDYLKSLKTPRVIGSDESTDYEIDNIIFKGSSISPENVRFDTLALENVDASGVTSDQHAAIVITFKKVVATLDDVKFAYRRKLSDDRGCLDVSLYGSNVCIELELKPCSTMVGNKLFDIQRVRCDASDICFQSATNDVQGLAMSFKPTIEMKVHRAIEQAVEDAFCKLIQHVDDVLINDYKWQISNTTMHKLETYEKDTLYGKGGIGGGNKYSWSGSQFGTGSTTSQYGSSPGGSTSSYQAGGGYGGYGGTEQLQTGTSGSGYAGQGGDVNIGSSSYQTY